MNHTNKIEARVSEENGQHAGKMRITLRLTGAEAEHLASMANSDTTGTENRSEFIRLLLAREWNRRKGLPKPVFNSIATAFRSGRPKAILPPCQGSGHLIKVAINEP